MSSNNFRKIYWKEFVLRFDLKFIVKATILSALEKRVQSAFVVMLTGFETIVKWEYFMS